MATKKTTAKKPTAAEKAKAKALLKEESKKALVLDGRGDELKAIAELLSSLLNENKTASDVLEKFTLWLADESKKIEEEYKTILENINGVRSILG